MENSSEVVRDHLLTTRDSANTMLSLINDILDYSRLDVDSDKLGVVSFEVRRLLEADSANIEAPGRPIAVENDRTTEAAARRIRGTAKFLRYEIRVLAIETRKAWPNAHIRQRRITSDRKI